MSVPLFMAHLLLQKDVRSLPLDAAPPETPVSIKAENMIFTDSKFIFSVDFVLCACGFTFVQAILCSLAIHSWKIMPCSVTMGVIAISNIVFLEESWVCSNV